MVAARRSCSERTRTCGACETGCRSVSGIAGGQAIGSRGPGICSSLLTISFRRKAELVILEKNFVPGLRASSEMAAMLDAFPDLGPELTKAMAGQIDVYMAEFDERFYPRAAAVIRESLSKDDVRTLTSFYTSALGQKMLELASENVDGAEIIERAVKEQPVDAGVTTRQAIRAGIRTYAKLSLSEREEIRKFSATQAGRNLSSVMPKISELQSELMNSPGPKFKSSSEAALADAFKRVTGIDPANP